MSDALVPFSDLESMALALVKGRLFPGIDTPEQAISLFMVAQAEGLHPMTAMMRYNIIKGRPAMKSEAMLASFMERGGTVEWTEYTEDAVTGVFTSKGVPKGVSVRWTMADAKRAQLTTNPSWSKYPKQMLKARVASDGTRMADPAVNQGRYTPEEVQDFEPMRVVAEAEIVAPEAPQELTGVLEASIEKVMARKAGAVPPTGPGLAKSLGGGMYVTEVGGKAKDAEPVGGESEPAEPPAVYRNKLFIKEPGPMQLPTPMPLGEFPAPERCAYCLEEGHDTPIGLYFSEQPEHEGEAYEQCSWAHAERGRLEEKGKSRQEAQAAVSRHYRAWAKKAAK